MAGMMRRAAVYLGLTDEQRFEDERYYDDYEDEYEPEHGESAAAAAAAASAEPRREPDDGSAGALVVAQNDRRAFAAPSNVTVMPDRSERSGRADRAERGGP